MQIHTFLAETVADAVSQIRETLGQDAVVLNVRRLPAEGLARLWQKPRIEVLAHVPEKTAAPTAPAAHAALDEVQVSALAELRAEMREMKDQLSVPKNSTSGDSGSRRRDESETLAASDESASLRQGLHESPGDWRVGSLLEQSGLLPVHAERVVADLCAAHGEASPISISDEIDRKSVV